MFRPVIVACIMSLSVIIPALNANHLLPGTIACLRQGADIAGVSEIIIADGGSSPAPSGLGEKVKVIQGPSGRGIQLKSGAEAASGSWLLFLHADTHLGAGWAQAVSQHIVQVTEKAGVFRFKLDDDAGPARLLEKIVELRCRLLALPYGDQGLLISRELYDAIGGFKPIMLMEDVDIVRRIGRSRLKMLDAPAITSARRYKREGYAKRMIRNAFCLTLFFLGVPPEKINRVYA